MYNGVLLLHSWVRWVALVAVVGTVLAALRIQNASDRGRADRWSLIAMATLDLQMLLGLLLYFALSPFTTEAMKNFGAAMADSNLRFWAVEHITSMFGAVIVAHIGRALARKASSPAALRRRLLICFALATVLIVIGTPWPGFANGRPLFRI